MHKTGVGGTGAIGNGTPSNLNTKKEEIRSPVSGFCMISLAQKIGSISGG
jgi:hypothetical protein